MKYIRVTVSQSAHSAHSVAEALIMQVDRVCRRYCKSGAPGSLIEQLDSRLSALEELMSVSPDQWEATYHVRHESKALARCPAGLSNTHHTCVSSCSVRRIRASL